MGADAGTTDMHSTAGPALPDVAVRYETRYLDIAPIFAAPLCAGTLAMLDSHVEHVAAATEIDVNARILVFLAGASVDPPAGWCHDEYGACYDSVLDVVFTPLSAAPHEIVHAITIRDRGLSFWNENVAHAFEDRYVTYKSLWKAGPTWPPAFYRNGHLARWLIAWGGGPAFMDLFAETRPGADQQEVEAAFRKVYGEELAEVLDEYAATAPHVYPDHLQCYVPSGTSEVPWNDHRWEHEVTLDCTQESTFTADEDISRMSARVPFSIAAAGKYRFTADHPQAEISVRVCIDEPLVEPFEDLERWPKVSKMNLGAPSFPVGRYVLEVSVPLGEPTTVRLLGFPAIEDQPAP